MMRPTAIFVACRLADCGFCVPSLAFETKDQALKWASVQDGTYSVAEVPIYPELPLAPWYHLKTVES